MLFRGARQDLSLQASNLDRMDLKFTFGASNPLPLSAQGAGSASSPGPGSSVLELRATLVTQESVVTEESVLAGTAQLAEGSLLRCEGVSADGVAYASAEKQVSGDDAASLAAALRSALARCGAELPEPLIGSVSAIALDLGGSEAEVLGELGLMVSPGSPILAQVDEALQSRTGITAGTPIRRA